MCVDFIIVSSLLLSVFYRELSTPLSLQAWIAADILFTQNKIFSGEPAIPGWYDNFCMCKTKSR